MKLTWRNEPNETGLARVCQPPRGRLGKVNGVDVVRVGWSRQDGWFWYGWKHNSLAAGTPGFATKADAQAAATEFYKAMPKEPSP